MTGIAQNLNRKTMPKLTDKHPVTPTMTGIARNLNRKTMPKTDLQTPRHANDDPYCPEPQPKEQIGRAPG